MDRINVAYDRDKWQAVVDKWQAVVDKWQAVVDTVVISPVS
jgi:hypothetical protein